MIGQLGKLSYPIYLFHWGVITVIMPYSEQIPIHNDPMKRLFIFIIDTLVVILVSFLFMKFINTPFNYLAAKKNNK